MDLDRIKAGLSKTPTLKSEDGIVNRKRSYHYKLGAMIAKVKKETKWRDIFKIVEKAQKKMKGEK